MARGDIAGFLRRYFVFVFLAVSQRKKRRLIIMRRAAVVGKGKYIGKQSARTAGRVSLENAILTPEKL
jgi:hypothetical protein